MYSSPPQASKSSVESNSTPHWRTRLYEWSYRNQGALIFVGVSIALLALLGAITLAALSTFHVIHLLYQVHPAFGWLTTLGTCVGIGWIGYKGYTLWKTKQSTSNNSPQAPVKQREYTRLHLFGTPDETLTPKVALLPVPRLPHIHITDILHPEQRKWMHKLADAQERSDYQHFLRDSDAATKHDEPEWMLVRAYSHIECGEFEDAYTILHDIRSRFTSTRYAQDALLLSLATRLERGTPTEEEWQALQDFRKNRHTPSCTSTEDVHASIEPAMLNTQPREALQNNESKQTNHSEAQEEADLQKVSLDHVKNLEGIEDSAHLEPLNERSLLRLSDDTLDFPELTDFLDTWTPEQAQKEAEQLKAPTLESSEFEKTQFTEKERPSEDEEHFEYGNKHLSKVQISETRHSEEQKSPSSPLKLDREIHVEIAKVFTQEKHSLQMIDTDEQPKKTDGSTPGSTPFFPTLLNTQEDTSSKMEPSSKTDEALLLTFDTDQNTASETLMLSDMDDSIDPITAVESSDQIETADAEQSPTQLEQNDLHDRYAHTLESSESMCEQHEEMLPKEPSEPILIPTQPPTLGGIELKDVYEWEWMLEQADRHREAGEHVQVHQILYELSQKASDTRYAKDAHLRLLGDGILFRSLDNTDEDEVDDAMDEKEAMET